MSPRFCTHLEDYGSLYTRAEASYLQLNNLVAKILDQGPDAGLVELLNNTLEEWLADDRELRTALVDLVAAGRVRIPKKKPRVVPSKGATCCSECRFKIPTLRFSEWGFAANGVVSFQGRELPLDQTVEAP